MVLAKKSLGQNWLKSSSAIKEIIKTADLSADDLVLEIGPGRGALTEKLLAFSFKVIAIEKDHRLMEFLEEKFASEISEKKLILIHDDILNLDFSDFLNNLDSRLRGNDKKKRGEDKKEMGDDKNKDGWSYKLVANIPYYITGQIIRKFLSEEKIQPSLMVLMLQKEVAKRIVTSDKKESLLSLSVKVYGEPKYIKTIPAGAFEPRPKVDSAILLIKNISRKFFFSTELGTGQDISACPEQSRGEEEFFATIKKGFGQKRKQLKGNLRPRLAEVSSREALAKWDKETENIFKACQIPEKVRAEDLTIEDWKKIILASKR